VKFEDVRVEGTIPIIIPGDFYDTWLNHQDLFMYTHCGYYWRLVESSEDPKLGHLAWDFEEDENIQAFLDEVGVQFIDHLSQEDENRFHAPAIEAWKAGKPLPPHYYAINKDVCTKAYIEGVKRGGTSWYEDGDATDYDIAFQMAVYGEHLYA
jgi:hypothetical protein